MEVGFVFRLHDALIGLLALSHLLFAGLIAELDRK